jgi:peptidoglycan/xylan/chitin deacetylase (PgdA/CDA1 family)
MSTFPRSTLGAVSLTFDDGMGSHLNKAIPILEQHDLRGTFYVMAKDLSLLERFRPARDAGHEIGNHTINHPWPQTHVTQSGGRGIEDLSLADMRAELDESIARYRTVFPEVREWGYAYPGYATWVGRGAQRTSYVPLVAERFFCARGGSEVSTPWNAPLRCDRYALNSWKCERRPAAALIDIVERTAAAGAWSIFTFHGVDEGHLPVSEADLTQLTDYLAAHRDRLWTAPVIDVARHLWPA